MERYAVRAVVRSCVSVVALVALYFALPLNGLPDTSAVVRLLMTVIFLIAALAWQVHAIVRSSRPTLRAIEAMSVTIPLFIVMVASTYVLTSEANDEAFSEALSKVDAMYFTMTVFSTVGFGDIAARSDLARMLVTAQIVLDLLLLGVGVRLIVGAVDKGKSRGNGNG